MQNEQLKIWLNPVEMEQGLTRIDIKTENAPADLFGVSFHLKGTGADFKLKDYEIGNVFGGTEPVLLVTDRFDETGHSVIYGVSLKRTDEVTVKDGVLSSFYIETSENGELDLDFSHQIASVYKDGRKDLENVIWEGTTLNIRETGAMVKKNVDKPEEVLNAETLVKNDLTADVLSVSKISPISNDQIASLYFFLFIAFFVLLILFGSYFMVLRKKWLSKARPVKTTRDIIREYEEGRHD